MKKTIALLSALICIAAIPPVSVNAEAIASPLEIVSVDGLTYEINKTETQYVLTGVENKNITTVTIPAEVNGCPVNFEENIFKTCSKLTEINVEEDNQFLQSIDGVLFSKKEQCILCYPPAKEDRDYIMPSGTTFSNCFEAPFINCEYLYSVTMAKDILRDWLFVDCPNLEYIKGCTVTEVGTNFFAACPNLKSLSFEGYQQQSLDFIGLNLEELIFKDDVSFDSWFELSQNTHIKELHVPQCCSANVLKAEKERTHPFLRDPETDEINDIDVVKDLLPDFGETVVESVGSVRIIDDEALEVLYLRYDSMHSGVKITNCPNLREIIIENKDEVLEDAMKQYSGSLIEYDSYLDLSNLPSLESIICYRPETNMYVRAEECGNFTMYGSKDNTKLQEVCADKEIPYSFLDGSGAYETGDVDGTGNIDIMDVILVNRYLMIGAEVTPEGLEAADVNHDGEVDAVDSLKILRYIVRIDEAL